METNKKNKLDAERVAKLETLTLAFGFQCQVGEVLCVVSVSSFYGVPIMVMLYIPTWCGVWYGVWYGLHTIDPNKTKQQARRPTF